MLSLCWLLLLPLGLSESALLPLLFLIDSVNEACYDSCHFGLSSALQKMDRVFKSLFMNSVAQVPFLPPLRPNIAQGLATLVQGAEVEYTILINIAIYRVCVLWWLLLLSL